MSNNILVAGDVILDVYWRGSSDRLSPEAPVPVVKVLQEESRLGGAANVALNLAKLQEPTTLCGLIGSDEGGNFIREVVVNSEIGDGLVLGTQPTVRKIRVLAQIQQVVRADFEKKIDEISLDRVTNKIAELIPRASVVIFSDYKKGVLARIPELIAIAKKYQIRTLIDPKGSDYSIYRGATVITPNKAELRAVVGEWQDESSLREKAQNLRKSLELEKLLLTRSEEGMTLFSEDEIMDIPTTAREVYDVSGAGDTAIAVLGMMLAKGKSWVESIKMANEAAGIVVGKVGTATITKQDLGI